MMKLVTREPVTEILVKLTEVAATLVTVMVCSALDVLTVCEPKLRLVGEKLMTVPTPVRATVCGLLGASSITVRVPVEVLDFVGVKTTLIVQLALAPRLEPQLFVWLKGPVVAMLLMLIGTVPVFVRVAGCEALLVLMSCAE